MLGHMALHKHSRLLSRCQALANKLETFSKLSEIADKHAQAAWAGCHIRVEHDEGKGSLFYIQ